MNALEDFLNQTDISTTQPVLHHHLHIERYISIILCFASSYVFISLFVYTVRHWNTKQVTKVNHLTVLSAFFSICLSLNKFGEQWIGVLSCAVYHWSATAVYVIGTIITYTVLWARQRKLYSDKFSAYDISRPMRIASAVVLIIIYCTISSTSFIFVTKYSFRSPYFPCIIKWEPVDALLPVNLTFMLMCFIFQFILYFLIVYPFFRHKSNVSMWTCLLCAKAETDAERMAKRLAFCLCACITTSTLLSITVLIDTTEAIVIHWCNFAAMDLLTNTIATTCALKNWRERLFGMFSYKKTAENTNSRAACQDLKLLRRYQEPSAERT